MENDVMMAGQISWKLVAVFAALLLVEALVLLFPGHLAISGHEVDVLHATEAAIRLSEGQAQHIDFMTPLGILAFKPISIFLDMGFGITVANMAGNLLIAALMIPGLVWVAARRLGHSRGLWFGVLTIIMVTAVVYGGDQATVSMSMYYNRWGWAGVFILVMLLLLPELGDTPRPRVDGAVIGAVLGFFLLLKITYFLVLAPAAALILLIDRDWQRLISAIVTGLIIVAGTTLLLGIAFWQHYFLDLLFVSATEARPRPGSEFGETLALPSFFPGTITLLAAIVGLRKLGLTRAGLVLFLLAPGFVYITYQNWGNDTKWLLPLGFACFVWSGHVVGSKIYGWDGRTYFQALGFISLAIIAPSFVNMTTSPIRNAVAADKDHVAIMADPRHSGLVIERTRSFVTEAMIAIEGVRDPNPARAEDVPEPLMLGDFEIPKCTLKTGYYGLMKQMADELIAAGYGDRDLALVDVANPLPLIAPIKRLDYVSPWYYGGTRDADGAEFLVVPKCPISQPTFKAYLNALNGSETIWDLAETQTHVWIFKRR